MQIYLIGFLRKKTLDSSMFCSLPFLRTLRTYIYTKPYLALAGPTLFVLFLKKTSIFFFFLNHVED